MTTVEFTKLIDNTSFSTNVVELEKAQKVVVKLKVMSEEEAQLFFENLNKFYPPKMPFERFVRLIEIEEDYKPVFPEEETELLDEEPIVEELKAVEGEKVVQQEEDEETIKKQKEEEEENFRIQILKKRNINAVETMLIKKATREIQRVYRGHFARKIYTKMKAKRISMIFRIQVISLFY
jgi:hypothetical protein